MDQEWRLRTSMTKFSSSNLFKQQLRDQRLTDTERGMATRLPKQVALWIAKMPDFGSRRKILKMRIPIGDRYSVALLYKDEQILAKKYSLNENRLECIIETDSEKLDTDFFNSIFILFCYFWRKIATFVLKM